MQRAVKCCDRKARAACAQSSHCGSKQQTIEIMRHNQYHSIYLLLVRATYMWCCTSRTSRSWWITHSTQRPRRGCNNIPSFSQQTASITHSFCEGFTQHDLHILVTAPFCCDQKARAAWCAQRFTLWAASNNRDHVPQSLYYLVSRACSRHIYVVLTVVLRAHHPVRGESHIQCSDNGEVATKVWCWVLYRLFVAAMNNGQVWVGQRFPTVGCQFPLLGFQNKILCHGVRNVVFEDEFACSFRCTFLKRTDFWKLAIAITQSNIIELNNCAR